MTVMWARGRSRILRGRGAETQKVGFLTRGAGSRQKLVCCTLHPYTGLTCNFCWTCENDGHVSQGQIQNFAWEGSRNTKSGVFNAWRGIATKTCMLHPSIVPFNALRGGLKLSQKWEQYPAGAGARAPWLPPLNSPLWAQFLISNCHFYQLR